MSNVNITSGGIQKILRKYNSEQAIAEYIWNGFDAKADTITVNYKANQLGLLEYLEIADNGYGINFDELRLKFEPFYESEKAIEITSPVHTSAMHGKNGVGRLTFFTFAHAAEWFTTFEATDGLKSGKIQMSAGRLNHYEPQLLAFPLSEKTGTTVTFRDLQIDLPEMDKEIIPFLITEFCWFLELNRAKNYKIILNGTELDYSTNITFQDEISIVYPKPEVVFTVRFVQWKETLHRELSKYYFINGQDNEVYKDFTTLNKKADDFFHSVYIKSNFLDDLNFKVAEDSQQELLFGKTKSSTEYKFLIKELSKYILSLRKPYLRTFGERMVQKFEEDGVLPGYQNERDGKNNKSGLEEILIFLYEAEPKLFTNLNTNQKKTFVRFLDLLLQSSEKDNILTVLSDIIDLEPEEHEEFASLLKDGSAVAQN
jgi:hypothetical protein